MRDYFLKKVLITKLFAFFFIDFLIKKNKLKTKKICWCAPFPPAISGGAFYSQQIIDVANKNKIDLFYLPVQFMNNSLFKLIIDKVIEREFFDYLILFTAMHKIQDVKKYTKKIIMYETVHNLIKNNLYSVKKQENEVIVCHKFSNKVIFTTSWAHKEYKYGSYIPLGVDVSYFYPKKYLNKEFQVLFVSRLCYYKGIVQFLQAIPLVLKKYPRVIFKIVGQIDKDINFYYPENNLKETISEVHQVLSKSKKEFRDNIVHINHLSQHELKQAYQESSLLVFPSFSEGFGLPIIEAMACGVPSIALSREPMNELIKDMTDGILIKPRNNYRPFGLNLPYPNDIAEKIIWFLDHPEEISRFGSKGRNKVIKKYNMLHNLRQLIKSI